MRSARARTLFAAILAGVVSSGPATASSGAPNVHAALLPGAPTPRAAWVAHIVIPTRAFFAPGRGSVKTVIPTSSYWMGGPVALLVLGARVRAGITWLRVLLPQRPNGASAWIDSDYTRLTRTPWRIDVSVRARTVSLLRAGRVLDSWGAVVGKPSTPTPLGLFAVYERVPEPDANDFLGTWSLHLTAFSEVLDNFDGGPGSVAIHGRGGASLLDPLGTARSHGCIRIDNGAIDVLARDAAEGTPVQIN